jgi:hypothetical protein
MDLQAVRYVEPDQQEEDELQPKKYDSSDESFPTQRFLWFFFFFCSKQLVLLYFLDDA